MLFNKIIFTCCKQINGERSISAIYHLLNGKKSIQTVQDAHIYHITPFYGILPSINKRFFDQQMNELIVQGYLKTSSENQSIYLTKKGDEWLLNDKSISLHGFDGISYRKNDEIFLNRLLLLIQMITNSKMNNYTYVPIVDQLEVTNWAKNIYREMNGKINETAENLYKELTILLSQLPEIESKIFVDRLTGYKTYGLSLNQLANKYHINPIDIQLKLVQITHKMMKIIVEQRKSFPILVYVMANIQKDNFITNSAYKTYQLLNNGHSVSEIARIRNLRENTVNDHLVEISLYYDGFPFHEYIDNNIYSQIIHTINKNNSYKLKDIKEQVNSKITYFQIRLALAKRTLEERSYPS